MIKKDPQKRKKGTKIEAKAGDMAFWKEQRNKKRRRERGLCLI